MMRRMASKMLKLKIDSRGYLKAKLLGHYSLRDAIGIRKGLKKQNKETVIIPAGGGEYNVYRVYSND